MASTEQNIDMYYCCDACAHVWASPEASRCENCGAHVSSLDEHNNLEDAEERSEYIKPVYHGSIAAERRERHVA